MLAGLHLNKQVEAGSWGSRNLSWFEKGVVDQAHGKPVNLSLEIGDGVIEIAVCKVGIRNKDAQH